MKIIFKTFTAAIILSVLFIIADIIQGSMPNLDDILWGFLSNLLIATVLIFYISRSSLRGLKLSMAIFSIYFLIGFFNILIEAYIFNVTDRAISLNALTGGFIVSLVFSPLIVLVSSKWEGGNEKIAFEQRSILSWAWRLIVVDLLYVFFYLLAGFILYAVYPPLMDFYEGKIPPFDLMINTQFFRAVVFIVVALLILRTMKSSRLNKALFIGILFMVIGGVAPLIPPNEHMPDYIRLGHAFEVAFSNFSFGFVLSYLLVQRTAENPDDSEAV